MYLRVRKVQYTVVIFLEETTIIEQHVMNVVKKKELSRNCMIEKTLRKMKELNLISKEK